MSIILSEESVHVIPSKSGRWVVKKSGSARAAKTFSSKQDAIRAGRTMGKMISIKGGQIAGKRIPSTLFVHAKDGRIVESDFYGKDPLPPRDSRSTKKTKAKK